MAGYGARPAPYSEPIRPVHNQGVKIMGTYLQDLKRDNPAKYADRIKAGGSPGIPLRNMIRALESMSALNTPEENERLAAAKRLQRNRY